MAVLVEPVSESHHVVHLYSGDQDLLDRLLPLIVSARNEGAAVILVATRSHRLGLEIALTQVGFDTSALIAAGELYLLDARDTVRTILVDDSPSPAAFDHLIGGLVREAAAAGRPVWVFGEMVDLLWNSGLVTAAIELEALWNELAERLAFSLTCAYEGVPAGPGLRNEDFAAVCALHTAVFGRSGTDGPPAFESRREFLGTVTAPAAAREFVAGQLSLRGHDALVDDAVLIVSELATNAMRHARSDFTVSLSYDSQATRITVADIGVGAVRPRTAGATDSSGRGLAIVGALATRWGWEKHPLGSEVWAELPCSELPAGPLAS